MNVSHSVHPRSPSRRLRHGVAVLALGITIVALWPRAARGQGIGLSPDIPPASVSRYMATVDPTTLQNEGCSQASLTSIQVLDFGQPWQEGSTYGTIIFDANLDFVSTSQIQQAVEAFLSGFWSCSSTTKMYLAVGTSNYQGATESGHGIAWAQMINQIANWISSSGFSSREKVFGASDIEPGFDTPTPSIDWAHGYQSAAQHIYFDYGSCDGCSSKYNGWGAPNGWTQYDVYAVAWGIKVAYPLPEIYYNPPPGPDTMASQWQYMSQYAYTQSNPPKPMTFYGEMTQWAASGNDPTTNTPAEGWTQLYNEINSSPQTVGNVSTATDITWAN